MYRRRRLTALAVVAAVVVAVVAAVPGLLSSPDRAGAERAGSGTGESTAGETAVAALPPAPAPFEGPYRRPVPILMYHEIGPPPPDTPYPELFVSASDFKQQLQWLERQGYEAVTLDALHAAWEGQAGMPERPVVVSFDDGLRGQYERALPKLAKRGWPGVLNLKLGAVEEGEMTEGMVREMIDAGWEVDSHTLTHPDVSTLSGAELRREVSGSRRKLQEMFGVPVNFFCYPAGRYDDDAVAAVERAGYAGATTTVSGLASPKDDPFALPRIRVESSDGVDGLAAKLG